MLFEIGSSVMNNNLEGIEASGSDSAKSGQVCAFGSNYYIRLIEAVT